MSKSPEKFSVQLTAAVIVELSNAVIHLNSFPEKVGDQIVQLPFLFPMQTKINIARNQRVLRAAVEDYQKSFNEIVDLFFPTKKERLTPAQKTEFDARQKELNAALIDLELVKLERDVIVTENSPLAANIWLVLEQILDKPL